MSIAFVLMLAIPSATDPPINCELNLVPLVKTEQTAKEIAHAILKTKQTDNEMNKFQLVAEIDADDSNNWLVYQHTPVRHLDDTTLIATTGGGIAMHINRCDASVTNIHFQR